MPGEIARQAVIFIIHIELMGRIGYPMHEQEGLLPLTVLLYVPFQMQRHTVPLQGNGLPEDFRCQRG